MADDPAPCPAQRLMGPTSREGARLEDPAGSPREPGASLSNPLEIAPATATRAAAAVSTTTLIQVRYLGRRDAGRVRCGVVGIILISDICGCDSVKGNWRLFRLSSDSYELH